MTGSSLGKRLSLLVANGDGYVLEVAGGCSIGLALFACGVVLSN